MSTKKTKQPQTLYQRLTPEARKKIDATKKEYPAIRNRVLDILKNNHNTLLIRVTEMLDICILLDLEANTKNLFSLFNETE